MKMSKNRRHRRSSLFINSAMKVKALFIAILVLVPLHYAFGQKQPDKISGYKVYGANVRVVNAAETDNAGQIGEEDAWIRIGDLKFVTAGLSGVTLEAGVEIGSASH